jgi:sugar lactone lactonase YvrE
VNILCQRKIVLLFWILSPVSSCALDEGAVRFDQIGRVWPDSDDPARIAYVGEFSNADDLQIRESFWRSVISVVVGPVKDALVRPMDVAATPDAKIVFVADPDAGCVHRYDLGRRKYRCLSAGRGESNVSVVGVTVTHEGHLFATDSLQGGIWQAGPKDTKLTSFYTSKDLTQPTGIHWRPDTQRLYVTDTGSHRVLEFDRFGNLTRAIGARGAKPGQFNYPTYLWIDPEQELLVADSLNFRVQRFDRDAGFLRAFGQDGDRPGDFSRPKGIATDGDGNVYVSDSLMHALQIFTPDGEFLLSIGSRGQGEGEFWLPAGMFITPDNTIFVADSYNKRVQVFRYIGQES